jgi:hypothetical protein
MTTSLMLPPLTPAVTSHLDDLTNALGVPRQVLPDDHAIQKLWGELPELLNKIPPKYRSVQHVRLCIAVATGLFDAALNYMWNSAILSLRDRVRAFGITVIPSITQKPFDEQDLLSLRDAELIALCFRLNLITADARFALNQARELRNNYSSAHPAMGEVTRFDVAQFLSRCIDHAIIDADDIRGLDLAALIKAMQRGPFTNDQILEWSNRIRAAHDEQIGAAVTTMHGMYCDQASNEETRLNCLVVANALAPSFTASTESTLVSMHREYLAKGDEPKTKASRVFFEKIHKLELLGDPEKHHVFSSAVVQLRSAHDNWDNFHNEPPFANRLLELSQASGVPATVVHEFVETIALCAIGNRYGVSRAAEATYHTLVKNFSPKEVSALLECASRSDTALTRRLTSYDSCKKNFKELVRLVNPNSVPAPIRHVYDYWVR